MYDYDSGWYLQFFASSFMKANQDKTVVEFNLDLGLTYWLMCILVFEIIKNFILIGVPVSNPSRYLV